MENNEKAKHLLLGHSCENCIFNQEENRCDIYNEIKTNDVCNGWIHGNITMTEFVDLLTKLNSNIVQDVMDKFLTAKIGEINGK